jgi:single-strand selective monofunctional uracil DNA glycosylase
MTLAQITQELIRDLQGLRFGPPVSHVYNPLIYAGEAYARYLTLYGQAPKEVLLLGMNPGPWGMAQTGVPFGEVRLVRDWLKIAAPVGAPAAPHPKRPVTGFACTRSEVSGARLWGWVRETFQTPERFFARFFVANYCPLIFIEAGGRNRTPDALPAAERLPLLAACDRALRRTVAVLKPRYVVGVGKFAATRALQALAGLPVVIGRLTHPSPANPAANRGWGALATRELADLGISLETP